MYYRDAHTYLVYCYVNIYFLLHLDFLIHFMSWSYSFDFRAIGDR